MPREPRRAPAQPAPAPIDIRSYESSPGFTQVETRAPGAGFVSQNPQDFSRFFQDLLKAKMDWERWKIQQQMRMARTAQAPAPSYSSAAQRGALMSAPRTAYDPGVPIYAGMQGFGINQAPGMSRPSLAQGPGMSAAGYVPRELASQYALPNESRLIQSEEEQPQISPEMVRQAFIAGARAPDTRAGYFGSSFGRS